MMSQKWNVRLGWIVAACVGVGTAGAVGGAWGAVITVNPLVKHQKIEGWGAHMESSDSATRVAYRDLGMNILRISMPKDVLTASSTDWRIRVPLGTDLNANVAKFNFNASSVAGYGATAQWLAANSFQKERFKLIADAWSVPHWMKGPTGASAQWVGNPSNDSPSRPTPWLSNEYNHWYNAPGGGHFHSYTGDSIGGRLRTEDATNLAEYGRYFAGWVKGWEQKFGVPITNVSLQNENGFENPFDSGSLMNGLPTAQGQTTTDYTQYAKALKSVRDAFAQQGVTTKIRGPHYANLQGDPSSPWGLNSQLQMIQAVRNDSDPTLKDAMSIYTSNYYQGVSEGAVKNTAAYWKGVNNVPGPWVNWSPFSIPGIGGDGKQNWFVETGDNPSASNGWYDATNKTGPLVVALKMHNALVHANASAYVYWAFVDGTTGPTEHGLLGSNQKSNPLSSKKYAAFKQFSWPVRPGAERVEATFENALTSIRGASEYDTLNAVNVSAFVNTVDDTFTVVLLNLRSVSEPITLNVPASLNVSYLTATRTSQTESFATLPGMNVVGGQVSFTLPGYSVMTLVGRTYTTVPEPGVAGLLGLGAVLVGRGKRRARGGTR